MEVVTSIEEQILVEFNKSSPSSRKEMYFSRFALRVSNHLLPRHYCYTITPPHPPTPTITPLPHHHGSPGPHKGPASAAAAL